MLQLALNDTSALRRFGWQMAVAWTLLFGLLLPWLFSSAWPWWPWLLSAIFVALAVVAPWLLYWPARAWLGFTQIMGWVNTRLILALLFFVIITPLGLVLRTLGKLDYRARPQGGDSYWKKADTITADNMKEPF
jgi:hypothetical protein